MKKLRDRIYYFVSFMPKRTVSNKVHGTAHHMNNAELYKMRTAQMFEILTYKNVTIYKLYKLKKWIRNLLTKKKSQ